MNEWTLGIDIAKDKVDVALYGDGQYQIGTFANSPSGFAALRRWLQKRRVQRLHACLEATGPYGDALAHFLYDAGHVVSIVNPARIKAYGASQLRRNKTDLQDAQLIAHFCATQQPEAWTPPPAEQQELQALVRHLADLQQMRQQERNRLQSTLTSEVVCHSLAAHLAFLDEQIDQLTRRIQDHIDHHPHLKQQSALLVSIIGIGPLTAAKLLAEVPGFANFDRADQLAAYAGLTPRQAQSGSSLRAPSRLAKTGNRHLRTALFMPALVAMRHNPLIQAFVARLQQRGKSKMAIVGAVMRKLLHLAYGVIKSGRPFDPYYAVKVPIPS